MPKLPSQSYSNGPGNLNNLGSNKDGQSKIPSYLSSAGVGTSAPLTTSLDNDEPDCDCGILFSKNSSKASMLAPSSTTSAWLTTARLAARVLARFGRVLPICWSLGADAVSPRGPSASSSSAEAGVRGALRVLAAGRSRNSLLGVLSVRSGKMENLYSNGRVN